MDCDFDPSASEFRVVLVGSVNSLNFESAIRLFTVFLAAVKFGMFANLSTGSVEEGVDKLKDSIDHPPNRSVEYLLRGIEVSSLRVLLNLLSQASGGSGESFAVSVHSPEEDGRRRRYHWQDLTQLPFQPWPVQTPFELLCTWPDDISFSPVIRMCFVRPLTENEIKIVEEATRVWTAIVKNGGYKEGPPFAEETFLQDIETYLVSPDTWEITLYGFRAHEVSFSSLIRFAFRFHGERCPLSYLEIQP